MAERKDKWELMADLLGYHLDLIDEATRDSVERECSAEELARSGEILKRTLAALAADEVGRPRADLTDRVMARVEAVEKTIPFSKSAPVQVLEAGRGSGAGGPLLRFRELVGLAAAIVLLAGIFVPGYRSARLASQQAVCADHLRMVGNGYADYAEANGGQLPFVAPIPPGASWLRVPGAPAPAADNSRNAYVLVKGRFVPARAFVCPGRAGDQPAEAQDLSTFVTFPNARNNSYAETFVAGPIRRDAVQGGTPLAADQNPMAEQPKLVIRASELPPNSRSHERLGGQNVLYGDISVRFVRTPNVGVDNDDIYRLIGVQEYTGRERPSLSSDVFLIP